MDPNTYIHVIDSPMDLFNYAHDKYECKFDHNKDIYCTTQENDTFHGNQEKVYEKYITHKVKDNARIVDDAIGQINSLDFKTARWSFKQRLTEGDSVDVNRYLDGQERCWSGVRREQMNKKVIRIITSFGGNCDKTKEQLAINGAIAVTLCEILESTGIGVELWAAEHDVDLTTSGKSLLLYVKLKGPNEFSDLGVINYITGDAHVFRNTVFRSWCRFCDEHEEETNGGLGHHGAITPEMFDDVGSENYNGTIVIPSIYDIDTAKGWLKSTLSERAKC